MQAYYAEYVFPKIQTVKRFHKCALDENKTVYVSKSICLRDNFKEMLKFYPIYTL